MSFGLTLVSHSDSKMTQTEHTGWEQERKNGQIQAPRFHDPRELRWVPMLGFLLWKGHCSSCLSACSSGTEAKVIMPDRKIKNSPKFSNFSKFYIKIFPKIGLVKVLVLFQKYLLWFWNAIPLYNILGYQFNLPRLNPVFTLNLKQE